MDLLADLRYAIRVLRKTPVFTVAAIGTLALGIGANTTIFSLVQTMLLEPLPYQNPDTVVMIWEDRTAAGFPRNTPAPANYHDWRVMSRSFTDMAATAFAFANVTGDGAPEVVLGRRVTANFFSVLGVVKDVLERGYQQESKAGVYVTQAQGPRFFPTVNLIVRVDSDPLGYAAAVQRIVRTVDPDQPIRLIRPMTEVIALTVGDRRQQTTLLVVFGALALVIASLGLYGLLAQTVSARGREIGIRMALGATWRNVMRMVMSRGIVLTGAGVAVGAVLAWSVTHAMETLLYGVGAADPLTFALVAGLLAAVSTIACAIPAVRAARVDPMLVLRDQ